MRLALFSDLHLEFSDWHPSELDVDAVVLAGDIWLGERAIAWAIDRLPGKTILYLCGNHEYYGHNLTTLPTKIVACAEGTQLVFMNRHEIHIQEVRILGCTLWTDFKLYEESYGLSRNEAMRHAASRLMDFKKIRVGGNFQRIKPQTLLDLHHQDRTLLLFKRLQETLQPLRHRATEGFQH